MGIPDKKLSVEQQIELLAFNQQVLAETLRATMEALGSTVTLTWPRLEGPIKRVRSTTNFVLGKLSHAFGNITVNGVGDIELRAELHEVVEKWIARQSRVDELPNVQIPAIK